VEDNLWHQKTQKDPDTTVWMEYKPLHLLQLLKYLPAMNSTHLVGECRKRRALEDLN